MGQTNQATVPTEARRSAERQGGALPQALQPFLDRALTWIEARGENFDQGVRIDLGDGQIEFRGWRSEDLVHCLAIDDPDAAPLQVVVRAFALLLKAREDLDAWMESEDPEEGAGYATRFEETLDLYDTTFESIDKAIDATVIRGGLVAARNLSRFRDQILETRQETEAALEQARQAAAPPQATAPVAPQVEPIPSGPREAPQPAVEPTVREHAPRPRPAGKPTQKAKAEARKKPSAFERQRTRANAWQARDTYRFPWAFCLLTALLITRWGMGVYLESISNPEPVIQGVDIQKILPLQSNTAVGGVFYGTVSDEWHQMTYQDKRDRFERLQRRAGDAGFEAVLVTDEAGRFQARWTQGGIPEVWTY